MSSPILKLAKLVKLTEQMRNIEAEMRSEMEKLWPRGLEVSFFIMSGQRTPSTGTVTGHKANSHSGIVTVLHHQAKAQSRYRYRDVPVTRLKLAGSAK